MFFKTYLYVFLKCFIRQKFKYYSNSLPVDAMVYKESLSYMVYDSANSVLLKIPNCALCHVAILGHTDDD